MSVTNEPFVKVNLECTKKNMYVFTSACNYIVRSIIWHFCNNTNHYKAQHLRKFLKYTWARHMMTFY